MLFCRNSQADVLWWMVDEDESPAPVVDWYGTPSSISDIGANSARLRVDGPSDTSTYLNFYILDPETKSWDLWPGDGGAGIPLESFADLGVYNDPAYSFAVELGNWEDGKWVKTLVASEPVSYDSIKGHIANWAGAEVEPVKAPPWQPLSYSVPEPSSGLLVLIGGALLALRRRKGG